MKFADITETGFYRYKHDEEENYIFEVIKNTNEQWLEKNPDATLLVDRWVYDYTDNDDRKHYDTNATLESIDCFPEDFGSELIKLDKEYDVQDTIMIEKKLTYKEQVELLQSKLNKVLDICSNQNGYIAEHVGMRTYSKPDLANKLARKIEKVITSQKEGQ